MFVIGIIMYFIGLAVGCGVTLMWKNYFDNKKLKK
jgi:hypothetical protein